VAERLLLVGMAESGPPHRTAAWATDAPLDAAVEPQLRRPWPIAFCGGRRKCAIAVPCSGAGRPPWRWRPVPLQVIDELREIDFGQWENRTLAEVTAEQPAAVDRWRRSTPSLPSPTGKASAAFLSRVHAISDRLVQVDASTVLVVTHGGVIRTMICHLLGLEPRKYVAFDVPYAALAVIEIFEGQGVLAALERPDDTMLGWQLHCHPEFTGAAVQLPHQPRDLAEGDHG